METDIPLRTLTQACAPDLLSLFGESDAEVVDVLSLEMPMVAQRLDNLLVLRDGAGNISLHLVEWQGYRDPLFLWRVLLYLGWLGLHRTERPITVTLAYLRRGDDVGDTLSQEIAGLRNWGVTFHCVRLWELDAADAVRTGLPGLAVLSPLMRDATATLVEEASRVVLTVEQESRRQADLLSVLGIFAEPLIAPERFVQLFEKERLMESKLLDLLMHDKLELVEQEWARKQAALEEERAREQAERVREQAERAREQAELAQKLAAMEQERVAFTLVGTLTRAVENAIIGRFPAAPLTLAESLRRVQDPERLTDLLLEALRVTDLETFERAVAAAGERDAPSR